MLSMKTRFKNYAIIAFISLGLVACSNDDEGDVMENSNTIADFVENNPDYSSLNAALIAADLKTVLAGSSDFTVFAPNNAAFNSFLSANGFANLAAVPKEVLTQVLLNHVQEGIITSSDLETGYIESMSTAGPGGENLSTYINTADGVTINGMSNVTTANVEVDNGIIHAVDAVIGLPDITTFATADPTFEILVAALTREEEFNFVDILMTQEEPAPFTVFAPTNAAFQGLLTELGVSGLGDIPTDVLAAALSYHVVTGANVRSTDISNGMMVTTFEGGSFTVSTEGGVSITDANDRVANVVAVDVQATNGVIHVLDKVLLPAME